jgi:hypothetical protein
MSNKIHPDDCTNLNVLAGKGHIGIKDEQGVTRITTNSDDLKSDKEIFLVIPGDKELNANSVSDSYLMFYCIDCGKPLTK